jgi:hypothetical protein
MFSLAMPACHQRKGESGKRAPLAFGSRQPLARTGKPSDVLSQYSMSAKNFGSTQLASGLLMGLVNFHFGRHGASARLEMILSQFNFAACWNIS